MATNQVVTLPFMTSQEQAFHWKRGRRNVAQHGTFTFLILIKITIMIKHLHFKDPLHLVVSFLSLPHSQEEYWYLVLYSTQHGHAKSHPQPQVQWLQPSFCLGFRGSIYKGPFSTSKYRRFTRKHLAEAAFKHQAQVSMMLIFNIHIP